ncbi:MAG: hypothetical protein JXR95_01875 [Deltaproteobacteria bacterium]|nr:hypothetical protein [Deltaproteobacteria bacterium]
MKKIVFATITAGLLITTWAFAQNYGSTNKPDEMGRRSGPKKQSIDACKGKKSGDSCSFTDCQGSKRNGTCMTGGRHGVFHCRPSDARGRYNYYSTSQSKNQNRNQNRYRNGRGRGCRGMGACDGSGQGRGRGNGQGRGRNRN